MIGRAVPYRPPRSGDLLAVRSDLDERHGVIDAVADNGRIMILTARFGAHFFDVVLRRVGPTYFEEIDMSLIDEIKSKLAAFKERIDETLHPEVDAIAADVDKLGAEVKADAETVAKDAKVHAPTVEHDVEQAAAPVVETAVKDVETLAAEAAADAAKTV